MKNILVLLESPTKVEKIKKYLEQADPEDNFTVLASGGHITKIPNSGKDNLGIDLETMTPNFVLDRSKSANITEIKKAGKKADLIILASDPDREGEAISWHLAQLFANQEIPIKRMSFDEITFEAINKAFHNLRDIDQNLVNAQFSRQMLDKIIGFLISGILQKATGLMSAGRVQTPALKLLVDRDKEIKAFNEIKYRKISVVEAEKGINLALNKDQKGVLINNPETYYLVPPLDETVINNLSTKYTCIDYKATDYETRSFKPYSTAGLLQDGFTKLHLSAQQVTIGAQKLYESGLVTYIRTDSQRYSDNFIEEGKAYIEKNYSAKLFALPLKPRTSNKENVQDAHESIRPTDLNQTPWNVELSDENQKRLYNLIWWNTLKSLMHGPTGANHRWTFDNNGYEFKQSWQEVKTLGYQALAIDATDEDIELDENDEVVQKNQETKPSLQTEKGFSLELDKSLIKTEDAKTMPPKMFNQASLVRELKKLGIGRPSTYAPILTKLQEREYVAYKKGKPIEVNEKGYWAEEYLYKKFADTFGFDYTAKMEATLDQISEGEYDYVQWLKDIYNELSEETKLQRELIKEEAEDICPRCHEGKLVFIKTRFGRGRGCSLFPITGCGYREYEQPDGTWKEYVEPTPEEREARKKAQEEYKQKRAEYYKNRAKTKTKKKATPKKVKKS